MGMVMPSAIARAMTKNNINTAHMIFRPDF